jgi:hypothetical protein
MSKGMILGLALIAAAIAYYFYAQQQAVAASTNNLGPGGTNGVSSGNTGATGTTGTVTATDLIPGVANPTPLATEPSAIGTPNDLILGVSPTLLSPNSNQLGWMSA